ncbi:MAG: hypothetical protein HY280_00680 [Nitrospinae bacterium]|nr:hypothetical protein [Nitrospinota bacterium]
MTAALLITACAGAPVKPPSAVERSRVLEKLAAANPPFNSMRMSGRAEFAPRMKQPSSKASVALKRPAKLKAMFHDAFGTAWFLLVVNEESVFYTEPKDGAPTLVERKLGVPIKLGPLKIVPEDVIENLYPSFDPAGLAAASLEFSGKKLSAKWAGLTKKWEFDGEWRIISAVIKRDDGLVKFSYAYGTEALTVSINSEISFVFNWVEKGGEIADGLFLPPPQINND